MKLTKVIALVGFGVALGSVGSAMIHAQAPALAPRQVLKTELANIAGQEAFFFAADWQPNQQLPWHAHPDGHEFVYVIDGAVTFEIDGVGSRTVKSGEVIHVPPNAAHRAQNAGGGPSKTLVVRIKDKSKPMTVDVQR